MIYICIPAHNEEQTVGVVLWKIRQVLTEFPRDYQLLVADDASTDKTADVLAPYARVLPLTVLRNSERRGYAASLEMLLREAVRRSDYGRRDAVLVLQADFTDEPEDITPLLKRIEAGADIVCGTHAVQQKPKFVERFISGWQQRVISRLSWPAECGDPMAGFRAYRLQTLKRALDEAGGERLLRRQGRVADVELLQRTLPHARRVEAIQLVHRPDRRQRPSRASAWETLKQLRALVKGTPPGAVVALSALAPEPVAAPKPLEVERERRNGAEAEAAATRRRERRPSRTPERRPTRDARPARAEKQTERSGSDRPRREPRSGPERQKREGAPERPRRPRAPAPVPAPEAVTGAPVDGEAPASEAPRKKRRRRRRGGAGRRPAAANAEGQPQAEGEAVAVAEAPQADGGGGDAPEGAAEGTAAAPKRRRRGGRRGGRGRRRPNRADGADTAGSGSSEGAGEPVGGEMAPAAPSAPPE